MFSARNRATLTMLAGVVATGIGFATNAAQAQSIVVRSSGPSATVYPQGKKLAVNAKVTLKPGDKLTVLDKAGTRVLAGPGSFTMDGKVSRDATAATRVAGAISNTGKNLSMWSPESGLKVSKSIKRFKSSSKA